MMLHAAGVDDATTILTGLGIGVACGLINGFLIGYLRVIPLACTLATLFLFGGIAAWLTGGSTLYGAPDFLRFIVRGGVGPIPSTVIIGLIIMGLAAIFIYRTSMGLHIRALGNLSAIEQVVGVRRRSVQLWVYGLAGLLFAIASLVQMGTLNSYYPSGGNDLLLPAVAAAALGGASLTGGSGSVFGAAMGALVLATVSNVFDLLGFSPEAQQIGIGVVLLATLLVERWLNGRRRRLQTQQKEELVAS
jgi:ribose transport system permease protein